MINSAGDEALAAVKVGEAARGTRIVLIINASDESDGGSGDVVDRLGVSASTLEVESVREMMGQRGLQRVVVRVRIGSEGFEIRGSNTLIGSAGGGVILLSGDLCLLGS